MTKYNRNLSISFGCRLIIYVLCIATAVIILWPRGLDTIIPQVQLRIKTSIYNHEVGSLLTDISRSVYFKRLYHNCKIIKRWPYGYSPPPNYLPVVHGLFGNKFRNALGGLFLLQYDQPSPRNIKYLYIAKVGEHLRFTDPRDSMTSLCDLVATVSMWQNDIVDEFIKNTNTKYGLIKSSDGTEKRIEVIYAPSIRPYDNNFPFAWPDYSDSLHLHIVNNNLYSTVLPLNKEWRTFEEVKLYKSVLSDYRLLPDSNMRLSIRDKQISGHPNNCGTDTFKIAYGDGIRSGWVESSNYRLAKNEVDQITSYIDDELEKTGLSKAYVKSHIKYNDINSHRSPLWFGKSDGSVIDSSTISVIVLYDYSTGIEWIDNFRPAIKYSLAYKKYVRLPDSTQSGVGAGKLNTEYWFSNSGDTQIRLHALNTKTIISYQRAKNILAKYGADTTRLSVLTYAQAGEQKQHGQLCLCAPKNEKLQGWLLLLDLERGSISKINTWVLFID